MIIYTKEPWTEISIVKLKNDNKHELSFMIFPRYNLKILIDTGSTASFLNSKIPNKYFKNSIKRDPFQVTTALETTREKFSIEISCIISCNYSK